MPNEVLIKSGTAIILADATDHSPATQQNLGTRTAQIDLTSLAAGSYRQSDKIDFGATRANRWNCTIAWEPTSAPTAGGTVDVYVAPSASATAGQDNPGNVVGTDGAYTAYGVAATDADECISQLVYIGSLVVSNDADVHVGNIGTYVPELRYGTIVVKNNTSVAHGGDAVESSIRLAPVIDEVQ